MINKTQLDAIKTQLMSVAGGDHAAYLEAIGELRKLPNDVLIQMIAMGDPSLNIASMSSANKRRLLDEIKKTLVELESV